ncbi:MAG: RNA polymerase factor sigma-54 [Desulfobacterales bacterium]|nr:RNA polymerase factor sigma-54 [Desulfobacterales bacterium]
MALELRQQLKLTQQLIMTPQLQMAIKLLQLSRLELLDQIHQELEENPALEEVQETQQEDRNAEAGEKPEADRVDNQEVTIDEKIPDDIDWSNYIDEYNSVGRTSFETENRDAPRYEAFISKKESLNDHLIWQLAMSFPAEYEQELASLIIGNLNKDGYLDVPLEDLVQASGESLEKVQDALDLVQSFDPVGVAARNLGECLLIQARHLGIDTPLITAIIENHMNHLENKNYKAISRALKVKFDEVVAAVNVIRSLEPRPGREFSEETPQYIVPDIYVYKVDDDFVIMLNDDGMPKLRVNSLYKKSLSQKQKLPGEAENYIQDKMRSAAWLIKSIHQRQKTIYKVMESILRYQRDFFEKGIAHLRPMVLRDVAQDIEMHESTISRVTTNKYAYTPQGIFELKYFFNSSIRKSHGGEIASASVQQKIKDIIANENPRKPYSDDKIAKLLKEANIKIARRTVAKYREILGILPSNKRKQI